MTDRRRRPAETPKKAAGAEKALAIFSVFVLLCSCCNSISRKLKWASKGAEEGGGGMMEKKKMKEKNCNQQEA